MKTLGVQWGFVPFLVDSTSGVMMIIGRLQLNPALRFPKTVYIKWGGWMCAAIKTRTCPVNKQTIAKQRSLKPPSSAALWVKPFPFFLNSTALIVVSVAARNTRKFRSSKHNGIKFNHPSQFIPLAPQLTDWRSSMSLSPTSLSLTLVFSLPAYSGCSRATENGFKFRRSLGKRRRHEAPL